MTQMVLSEQRDGISILTLNRPESLNALNPELVSALLQALVRAIADDGTRVIILRGSGRAFCTGNDMKESQRFLEAGYVAAELETRARELQEITRQIFNSDKIVIGACHGWAVGAGFELAINCDFTIWAEDARASFPEVSWGLFTTGGILTLLPKIVGLNKAREMLLFGETYSAGDLLDYGLAWRLVPESALFETALEEAGRISGLPRATTGLFKKVFNRALFMGLEDTLEAEVNALVESMGEAETLERILQFGKGS